MEYVLWNRSGGENKTQIQITQNRFECDGTNLSHAQEAQPEYQVHVAVSSA